MGLIEERFLPAFDWTRSGEEPPAWYLRNSSELNEMQATKPWLERGFRAAHVRRPLDRSGREGSQFKASAEETYDDVASDSGNLERSGSSEPKTIAACDETT